MIIGRISDELLEWRPLPRAIVLGTLAMAAVTLLAAVTRQGLFLVPALAPALAGAIALERWTRRPRTPDFPHARVV
jgi:hypothetical protein